MSGLSQRTFSAVVWSFGGTFANQVIQFVVAIALARLLSPEDFGVAALLTVFTLLGQSMIESGYGSALIQMQDVNDVDESAVFYFNLIAAALLCVVFWFLAVPIAAFYREANLVAICRVFSLVFIFNAFGMVQSCLFAKQLNFHAQSKAQMWASAASGALGITLAQLGLGVWSLVLLSVSSSLVRSSLYWAFSSWRPVWRFSLASLRRMFPYGSRLLVSGLLGTVFDNLYPMIIGHFFTKADLGYYSRAQLTQRQVADSVTGSVISVSFPAYASIQHDKAQLREGYRRSIIYTSVVLLPLILGLSAIAKPLFIMLFSDKWSASIPYFRVLCLSGVLYHLHALNLNVLKASGRSDLYLRLSVAKVIIATAGVLVACRFGIMGVVWGQVAVSWICLWVNAFYTGRIIKYSMLEQLADVWPYAAVSGVCAGCVYLAGTVLGGLPWAIQVVGLAAAHAGLYMGLSRLLRIRAPFEVISHLKSHFARSMARAKTSVSQ